jgi:hypothetical protein
VSWNDCHICRLPAQPFILLAAAAGRQRFSPPAIAEKVRL